MYAMLEKHTYHFFNIACGLKAGICREASVPIQSAWLISCNTTCVVLFSPPSSGTRQGWASSPALGDLTPPFLQDKRPLLPTDLLLPLLLQTLLLPLLAFHSGCAFCLHTEHLSSILPSQLFPLILRPSGASVSAFPRSAPQTSRGAVDTILALWSCVWRPQSPIPVLSHPSLPSQPRTSLSRLPR